MHTLIIRLARPFRPRIGWAWALVGLATALCIPLAIGDGPLQLPTGTFVWAAMLGFGLGLRSAPPVPDTRSTRRRVRDASFWILVELAGAVLLALAAEDVLPPLPTVLQDTGAYIRWSVGWLRGNHAPAPLSRAAISFAETLPRFWERVLAAPTNGRPGARTMVDVVGVALTWISTLLLGRALLNGRALLAWQIPFLLTITLITVFGSGSALSLLTALALLLLLVVHGETLQREQAWERDGADFSDELRRDVLMGGGALVIAVLVFAAALPAWFNNPLASNLWNNVETPSGLAELEKQVHTPGGKSQAAQIGLSNLPALSLGQSLEQGPPEREALRIHVGQPLPNTPVPHYWRARLFDIYSGRDWTTDARVSTQQATNIISDTLPGLIVQTIEDVRQSHTILPALPDAFAMNVNINTERLPDGTIAAMTVAEPLQRYQAISRPQEFAEPPPLGTEPPDLSMYLVVPPSLTSRVVALAKQLTVDAPTSYQKALALEKYLRTLPYSYQVTPLPPNGDAVDFFLFNSGTGYCTYYASAMAVMARSLGIPARVATGYFTGSYDAATQTYIVHENDAHAWPELYIDGRWLAFEPTPIRPAPARNSTEPPAVEPVPVPVVNAPAPNRWWVWPLVLVASIGVSLWLWRRPLRQPLPLAIEVQQQIERLGRRAGVPWPKGATLHGTVHCWHRACHKRHGRSVRLWHCWRGRATAGGRSTTMQNHNSAAHGPGRASTLKNSARRQRNLRYTEQATCKKELLMKS